MRRLAQIVPKPRAGSVSGHFESGDASNRNPNGSLICTMTPALVMVPYQYDEIDQRLISLG